MTQVAGVVKRYPGFVVAFALLLCGAGAVLALSTGHAVISGHVYHCDRGAGFSEAARRCSPGEPVANLILRFDEVHGSRSFIVSTGNDGGYAVSVDPGSYVVLSEIIGTPEANDEGKVYISQWQQNPIRVSSGQHVVLDLTSHSVTQ